MRPAESGRVQTAWGPGSGRGSRPCARARTPDTTDNVQNSVRWSPHPLWGTPQTHAPCEPHLGASGLRAARLRPSSSTTVSPLCPLTARPPHTHAERHSVERSPAPPLHVQRRALCKPHLEASDLGAARLRSLLNTTALWLYLSSWSTKHQGPRVTERQAGKERIKENAEPFLCIEP